MSHTLNTQHDDKKSPQKNAYMLIRPRAVHKEASAPFAQTKPITIERKACSIVHKTPLKGCSICNP